MRRLALLATVGSVSSDDPAPVPARAPGLYVARRGRFGLAGLAGLASLAAWVLSIRVPDHGPRVTLSLLAVLAVLAMLAWAPATFRRRWPVPFLVLATAVVAVEIATGDSSVPFTLVLAFAAYNVATSLPRRWSIRAALAAAVVIGGALLACWVRAGPGRPGTMRWRPCSRWPRPGSSATA